MREIIIDTDAYYNFSSGRNCPIIIYEYLGNGEIKKLHGGYIDSCIGYLEEIKDETSIIWTDYNEPAVNRLKVYLIEKNIDTTTNREAYNFIKRSGFRQRFISYWMITKPERYERLK